MAKPKYGRNTYGLPSEKRGDIQTQYEKQEESVPIVQKKQEAKSPFICQFKCKFGVIGIRKDMIEEWTKKLGRAEFYNVPNKYKYISHQYIGAFIEQLANSKHVTIQRNRPGCPLVVKNGTEEYDIPVEIFWSCIHMDIRNKFRDPTDTIHNLQSFLDILGTEVTIQE